MWLVIFSNVAVPLMSALIGALAGSYLSSRYASNQFKKQTQVNSFVNLVNEIDTALVLSNDRSKLLQGGQNQEAAVLTPEIFMNLNKAFSKALVLLDDEGFKVVDDNTKGEFDKRKRNKIYHEFRKSLYPNTGVKYETIQDRFLQEG